MNFEIKNNKNPIDMNLGVKNIFNTSYTDHLSRFKQLEIPNQGINFYLSIKLKLDKAFASKTSEQ